MDAERERLFWELVQAIEAAGALRGSEETMAMTNTFLGNIGTPPRRLPHGDPKGEAHGR